MKKKKLFIIIVIFCMILSLGFFSPTNMKKVNAASKIKFTKTSVSIYVGKSKQVKIKNSKKRKNTIYYQKKKITFTSSNKKVATVSKYLGRVTAKKSGTCYITAKIGKKKTKCKIIVKKKTSTVNSTKLSTQDKILESYQRYGAAGYPFASYFFTGDYVGKGEDYYVQRRQEAYKEVGITKDMDDVKKAYLCAKWISNHVKYDNTTRYNYTLTLGQSYQEAFDTGKAVCAGFARTYNYLVSGLGMKCAYVYNLPGNHAWPIVKVNGSWYTLNVQGTCDSADAFLKSYNIIWTKYNHSYDVIVSSDGTYHYGDTNCPTLSTQFDWNAYETSECKSWLDLDEIFSDNSYLEYYK